MRFSSFRTFWISVISVLVMLLSSFASSASSLSMQMDMMNGHQMSASVVDYDMGNPPMDAHSQHHASPHSSETSAATPECEGDSNMVHNCCSATCFTAAAMLSPAYQSQPLMTQLALISSERDASVIDHPHSLYRPPIA